MSSLIGKYQIAANPASLTDGDSIASYLVDSAGALLTSTLVGGTQQSLDVNVTQSALPAGAATETTLAAILADFAAISKADSSAHTTGNKGVMSLAVRNDTPGSLVAADGEYAPLQVDANGNLRISGTITVTDAAEHNEDDPFTNGDRGIFTLLVRQDTLASSTSADGDYGAFKSTQKGELYTHDADALAQLVSANSTLTTIASNTGTTATNTGSIATSATAIASSVASIDGKLTSANSNLQVMDRANTAILQQQVSVTSTASALPASALANRRSLMIQNTGSAKCYIGAATVTVSGATAGIELPANAFMELEVGPAVAVYAIKNGAGGNTVNILEMA